MRWTVADEAGKVAGRDVRTRCADCGEWLLAGDVVVVFDQGKLVYVHDKLFVHRRHLDECLADAPTEEAALAAQCPEFADLEELLSA